jgi:hypothetical protein
MAARGVEAPHEGPRGGDGDVVVTPEVGEQVQRPAVELGGEATDLVDRAVGA